MGIGEWLQVAKDIKNGLEVNAAALALAGSRNAAGTRISRIDTPITAHTADMYGKIIYQDDFEARDSATINWVSGGANAGANNSTRYTTLGNNIFRGGGSLLVETTATTPADGHAAQATKYLSMRKSNKIQVETMFALGANAYVAAIAFQIVILNGTSRYYGYVRYNAETPGWEYATGATPDWTALTGSLGTQNLNTTAFHYVKFSFDIAAETWLDIQCDQFSLDARGLTLFKAANVTPSYQAYIIAVEAAGANQAQAYADDVLITDITESV